MAKIEIICAFCGKPFLRCASVVRYREKHGMRNYCNLSCVGKQNNSQLEKPPKGAVHPNLVNHTVEQRSLAPFRQHLRSIKSRRKEKSITLEDLLDQWNKQGGKCPYTGWEMDNGCRSRSAKWERHPKRASLDRIDSSKGYVKGNIQYVCLIAQYAKNQFKEEDLFEFCRAVNQKLEVSGIEPESKNVSI